MGKDKIQKRKISCSKLWSLELRYNGTLEQLSEEIIFARGGLEEDGRNGKVIILYGETPRLAAPNPYFWQERLIYPFTYLHNGYCIPSINILLYTP